MLKHINLILIASLSIILLFSCEKKTEEAGLVIQPDENRLKVYTANMTGFSTYTDVSDPITTNRKVSYILLGSIDDANFGRTSAFISSQYRLNSDNVSFGLNATIVSVKAYMDVVSFVGDSSQSMRYMIYKSNFVYDNEDDDKMYDSDVDYTSFVGDLIADQTIQKTDSFDVLTIPMNDAFGQEILEADSQSLIDNDSFLEAFKGLYITVDTTGVSDNGLIWKFDFNSANSYIELEYTTTDTSGVVLKNEDGEDIINTFKLQFNASSERFNIITNNNYPLLNAFGQESDQLYISGLGATRGHIGLSPVLTFKDSGDIMIYKAELIANANESSSNVSVPAALLMDIDLDIEDSIRYVDDISASVNNYGGLYKSEDQTYRMVITRQVQNLINNNHSDSLLWISPYSPKTNPNRVILSNDDTQPLTLKITYSKLN